MTRYAWLQKHPTPAARAGEFHWYPSGGDRELQAAFAERLPSANGGALWQLAPDEVAWALPFVAVAADGRRYTGLALAVADSLAHLVPAVAAPWTEATAEPLPATPPVLPDLVGVARALLDGGSAVVGDPAHLGLPRAIAAIERVMPPRGVRRGTWTAGIAKRGADRVAELAAQVVLAPGSRAACGWQLACELATAERSVDDVVAAIAGDPGDWIGALNAWGRGKVMRDVDELADRVALRVLARLIADRDPAWAIAEARWHALLPAHRRTELLTAVARRAGTLKALIHG
ncbi:MAG TPA: hypothetical protein VFQ65_21580 [Kofleriaceae bacterium]|nr:hypothetical protein [Kofleriaceae bacterium]